MSTFEPPEPQTGDTDPDSSSERPLSELAQITRAMIAIYKEQFGRGPRYAATHYSGPNAITTMLEGTLTPVERTLANIGEDQRLRDLRALFQHAAAPTFRGAVEDITGRSVLAFTSGTDTQADVSTEHFVLAPNADDPGRQVSGT
jgi:uncharacterized protein YbcI